MRRLLILLFIGFSIVGFSQNYSEGQLRTSIGVKGKITKPLAWSADLNFRFMDNGLSTFFPQLGLSYKVTKWFKPSLDYRMLVDKNKYGNYKLLNRLNLNLKFSHKIKRFDLGLRLRYQFAFSGASLSSEFDPDFDQAFRVKPAVSYNIKKSMFTPKFSTEFYFNPDFVPYGGRFIKYRIAAGTGIKLKGPNELDVKYFFEGTPLKSRIRHVFSIGYTRKF